MRKLLPYEHQLIESLGITKEDYLNFVAIQKDYKDPKAGTALDVRNEAGTVALVLTVVGILFQVGAALLAPKPDLPSAENRRRSRQQRFSPAYGFNSAQDLATYGDPVNLVYTNAKQNPGGSVRVNGSLVWSSIENFGSSQFMQLVVALGASKIRQIKFDATAFGQKDLRNFDKANFFIFGKSGGTEGVPTYGDLRVGHDQDAFYPKRLRVSDKGRPACSLALHGNSRLGFSQAYSPTTGTSLGVFDAIPINVNVYTRDKDGDDEESNVAIYVASSKQGKKWTKGQSKTFEQDDVIEMHFKKGSYIQQDKDPGRQAGDIRRQAVDALDFSSVYLLGSAKFRLAGFVRNREIEKDTVRARFKCIERGARPSTDYDRTHPKQGEDRNLKAAVREAIAILQNKQVDPDDVRDGAAPRSTEGSDEGDITAPFSVKSTKGYPNFNISYTGQQTVKWIPEFEIVNDDGKVVDKRTLLEKTLKFDRGGSIEHTQRLRGDVKDDLVLEIDEIRKEITRGIKDLEDLIDDIKNNDFDNEDVPWGNHGYRKTYYGRDPNERKTQNIVHKITVKDIKASIRDKGFRPRFDSYDSKIQGKFDPWKNGKAADTDVVYFTFMYIDHEDNWHFFNFNGIYKETGTRFFKRDPRLKRLRSDIKRQKRRRHIKRNRPFKSLESIEEELEELRDKKNKRVNRNFNRMHKKAIKIIREDIKHLERTKDQLPGKDQDDRVGIKAVKASMKDIIKRKKKDLETLQDVISNWDSYTEAQDNTFFSKCLVKAEKASYETLSECDIVKFSLKTKLFRRISGRQKKYGEEKVKEYSQSDNGVKSRLAFFRVFYKGNNDSSRNFKVCSTVFAVRRGSEADFYTEITFRANNRDRWSFMFEPVHDMTAEYNLRPFTEYAFLEETDRNPKKRDTPEKHTFSWTGRAVDADPNRGYYPNEDERGPVRTNEWDMFSVNSDTQVQFSFDNGPELALTAVSEQQLDGSIRDKYKGLTMMALGLFANRGLQDLRSISALVEHGKGSYIINQSNNEIQYNNLSSSYAPDIFIDTLLDKNHGVGKYVTSQNLDVESLSLAKKFCINNKLPLHETSGSIRLFMDGVIADKTSWREFWVNVAPFSLLELARKNGKETLVPAFPVNGAGAVTEGNGVPVEVPVSALFTAGNILEGSYKEEFMSYGASTEDLIASVVYREFKPGETFSQNRTVDVRLAGVSDGVAIRETFDISNFVTQREQAILFGKMLCNQRRHIRRGVEFKTFPSEAMVEPGSFIYVDIGLDSWDKHTSGLIMEGGELNTPISENRKGNYNFLLYKPGTGDIVSLSAIEVSEQTTPEKTRSVAAGLASYQGYMFVMGKDNPSKRVYRVTEVALEEDGELNIKAVEYNCFTEGGKTRASIADFRSTNFEVS